MLDLSIVVVSFNTKELTVKCLQSIYQKSWKNKYEVWVVDNASSDGTTEAVRKLFPTVKLIEGKENIGFAGGNNLALKKVNSKYSLLLNSDTEVQPASLDNLVDFAKDKGFAIVSCKLIDKKGNFQPNAGELPGFGPVLIWLSGLDDLLRRVIFIPSYQGTDERYYKEGKQVGWVSGSAMLIQNDVFRKIGFLDEAIFMYGEDVEYCLRAQKAGFKVGWTNQATVIHKSGGSLRSPHFNQWRGEFRGLLYIYKKYYGFAAAFFLRLLIYIFILARVVAFAFLGKFNYSKTYAKIIVSI